MILNITRVKIVEEEGFLFSSYVNSHASLDPYPLWNFFARAQIPLEGAIIFH